MTCYVPVAVSSFHGFQSRKCWYSSTRQRAPSLSLTKGDENTTPREKIHHHRQQLKMAFKLREKEKKTQRLTTTAVLLSWGPFLKKLKTCFLLPFLSSEEKCTPVEQKRRMCRRGDSGAFLFVSPLEPSLPWEPCRPGNKQSFVSTDPLCPAARLQTSTPVLIGNHRRGSHSSQGRGGGSSARLFSHPPVLSSLPIKTSTVQAGRHGDLVNFQVRKIKRFFPRASFWHQTLGKIH